MNLSPIEVQQAFERISAHVVKTPLVFSKQFGVWLKLETQQPTGSFKVRPAFNGILKNLDKARNAGVLASSSGNFAQAVAYAAGKLGVSAQIVMPSITKPYKIERTRALGADVVISGPSFEERWQVTAKLERESGRLLVHPYDSEETICGDATIALELLEQIDGDFCVVVPASGGGMAAGIGALLKSRRPRSRVVAVQPRGNGALLKSLEEGRPVNVGAVHTIADALVASEPGARAFDLVRQNVDQVVVVDDGGIRQAVAALANEQKLVVEPGGAAGVAALLEKKIADPGMPIVIILSGGNIDPRSLAEIISERAPY